jgi:hypothetical protein
MRRQWLVIARSGQIMLTAPVTTIYEGWNKNSLYTGKPLLRNGRKP